MKGARRMCKCKLLLKAIEAYIRKADNDLKDQLSEEGFLEADTTIEVAEEIEERVAEALKEETELLTSEIADIKDVIDLEAFYRDRWPELKGADDLDEKLKEIFIEEFSETMPKLAAAYIKETDAELTLTSVSKRTTDWVSSWSEELGQIMKLNSSDEIEGILLEALDEGLSIEKVTEKIVSSGIRDEYFKARRTALTEVLRAHSVAQQEGMMQSPAVDTKTWVHTGTYKIKPRMNHVNISGQTVPKDKPYTLIGANGNTYFPMYPRDPLLPAAESVNCHCLSRANASDDILGMSLEERKKLQQKAIDEDDGAWEKELDAKNKAKAGIDEETIKMDWLKKKDKAGQVKYLGSKNRWALVESGVIKTDEDLEKLFTKKTVKGKTVRVRKTLKDLQNDGIMTVSSSAIRHSTFGDFSGLKNPKKPAGGKNGGNMQKGGHSQTNIDYLESQGINYKIEKTYKNGVRIGGVENHGDPERKLGQTGQAWFPENWTGDDVLVAGTYVANFPENVREIINEGKLIGYRKFSKYKGITIGVITDSEDNVRTIFPDKLQRKVDDIND